MKKIKELVKCDNFSSYLEYRETKASRKRVCQTIQQYYISINSKLSLENGILTEDAMG